MHTEPLTLRNLPGTVPPIRIKCRRTKAQQFALQVIDCERGTVFESVEIEGDKKPAGGYKLKQAGLKDFDGLFTCDKVIGFFNKDAAIKNRYLKNTAIKKAFIKNKVLPISFAEAKKTVGKQGEESRDEWIDKVNKASYVTEEYLEFVQLTEDEKTELFA